jgi:hypothetical protein
VKNRLDSAYVLLSGHVAEETTYFDPVVIDEAFGTLDGHGAEETTHFGTLSGHGAEETTQFRNGIAMGLCVNRELVVVWCRGSGLPRVLTSTLP